MNPLKRSWPQPAGSPNPQASPLYAEGRKRFDQRANFW
jgi:hypothetical protein